jgi:sulfide:quinone oxidoreductase
MRAKYKVVVVGGGAGGLTAASQLLRKHSGLELAVIEPSEDHYYQPGWTLCGGIGWDVESTRRNEGDVMPKEADWIKEYAESFQPEENKVTLRSGESVEYEYLIVAPGIKLDWAQIAGLNPDDVGKNGVTSIYTTQGAAATWEMISEFRAGTAVFTQPVMPIKCAGAPQKIVYLSGDNFQTRGVDHDIDLKFCLPGVAPFGVADFVPTLKQVIERYGVQMHYRHNLTKVDVEAKEATFDVALADDKSEQVTLKYDLLHVVPPQCAPDFVRSSPLANEAGWVDVDQHTLQHTKFPNVFSLGDASSTPNSKTAAAIRKQAPVLVKNLTAVMQGKSLDASYNGYASCPLITKKGKVVLAEFGYGGKLMPSFPLDPTQERFSMWMLKTKLLPPLYWHLMLRGHNV